MKSAIRNLFCALIAATLGFVCSSAGGAGTVGEIRFIAAQEGVPLQGTFSDFTANIKFDPERPDTGEVQVRVEARSVNTGTAAANQLIRSEDFFDAATFPQATFVASEFRVQDAAHYLAKGVFTLKGKAVSIPVTFATTASPQGRWFDGAFTISRTLFRVGQGEWADTSTLDDAVKIQFHILQEGSSPR